MKNKVNSLNDEKLWLIEELDNTWVSVNNLKKEIIWVNESGGDT